MEKFKHITLSALFTQYLMGEGERGTNWAQV